MSSKLFENALYTKDHEWVLIEGKQAIVGITDYAQDKLGDIVFIDLPTKGQSVARDEGCAIIESVKAASDVYAPLTGTIIDINEKLEDEPSLTNQDPYGEGFLFKVEIATTSEIEQLMSAEEYQKFVSTEG